MPTTPDVRPCADPEHGLYHQSSYRGWSAARRVSGRSVGLGEQPVCPNCYRRRYARLERAGLLPGRTPGSGPPKACPNRAHRTVPPPAGPPPELPEDLDRLGPAEISRLVRRLWGTPAACMVLTSDSWSGAEDGEEEED